MVDIPGLDKGEVGRSAFYDMEARYTDMYGKSVRVGLLLMADPEEAVKWAEKPVTRKHDKWEPTSLLGYNASIKKVNYTASEKKGVDILMRIAAGNLGVSVNMVIIGQSYNTLPLEEAEELVDTVARSIIGALEKER